MRKIEINPKIEMLFKDLKKAGVSEKVLNDIKEKYIKRIRRKQKPENLKRIYPIVTKLSKIELQNLKKIVKEQNTTASNFIRNAILKAIKSKMKRRTK